MAERRAAAPAAAPLEALAAAQQAHEEARLRPAGERAGMLADVAELHRERSAELAEIVHREMGKPLDQARAEIDSAAAKIQAFVDNAEAWLADRELSVADGLRTVLRKQPLGVILGVMPWNYPVSQVARFAAPSLLLGNTVLVKLPAQCPETARALTALYADAGVPPGGFACLEASHEQISQLIADERIRGVSVTGSERAGAALAAQAGRHLKKCVLELGGSDPFIVLDVADVQAAAAEAVKGRMENSGQACNGSKRIIVLDSVYEEFITHFVAAMDAQSAAAGDYGPLASEEAAAQVSDQVQRALQQGARLLTGSAEADGRWITPSVLTDVSSQMEIYHEEVFGPVATVFRVPDDEAARRLADDTPFGLGAVILADDQQRAERLAEQLDVGMVFIGAADLEGPDVPFGGVKRSGYGRELGEQGIDEFANLKVIRYAAAG